MCRCCARRWRRRGHRERLACCSRAAGGSSGHPRRADGHPQPRRADHRRQRHRQERVRARSRCSRPPARRRRHGGGPAAGRDDLIGTCPDLTRHHMEVRGLGVINIRDLFGVAATRVSKRIELVVQLERWDPSRDYDRLGLDETIWELFGVKMPARAHAGRTWAEPRDPRRGRRTQPAAPVAWSERGARPGRTAGSAAARDGRGRGRSGGPRGSEKGRTVESAP